MTAPVTMPEGVLVPSAERPKRRRGLLVAIGAILVIVGGIGLGVFWVGQKEIAEAWVPCGIGNREVRSIAINEAGRIFVAANESGRGDVYFSDDRCASFTPVGLETEVVWSVSWLPRAQALCAGTRDGLRCLVGGALRDAIPSTEIYFAHETRDGIVAGGYPTLWFGKMDVSAFAPVLSLSHAASDAAVTDWATLVAGPGLLASLDGGHTFAPLPAASFEPRALAAVGSRVWAGGGSFGGFLMKSDDGGQTWAPVPLPGSQPEVLRVVPGRPDVVLLGTHGDLRPGDAYLSIDAGRDWRALGCPGAEIHALEVDDDAVYCGATSLSGTRGMWRMTRSALGLGAPANAI